LAKTPVNRPTVAGQLSSSIPIGAKAGVMVRPMAAGTDRPVSAASKLPSVRRAFKK
jgi:hypothetical protein